MIHTTGGEPIKFRRRGNHTCPVCLRTELTDDEIGLKINQVLCCALCLAGAVKMGLTSYSQATFGRSPDFDNPDTPAAAHSDAGAGEPPQDLE